MRYFFIVRRLVREMYEVEIESEVMPTKEDARVLIQDPRSVTVLSETVKRNHNAERRHKSQVGEGQ